MPGRMNGFGGDGHFSGDASRGFDRRHNRRGDDDRAESDVEIKIVRGTEHEEDGVLTHELELDEGQEYAKKEKLLRIHSVLAEKAEAIAAKVEEVVKRKAAGGEPASLNDFAGLIERDSSDPNVYNIGVTAMTDSDILNGFTIGEKVTKPFSLGTELYRRFMWDESRHERAVREKLQTSKERRGERKTIIEKTKSKDPLKEFIFDRFGYNLPETNKIELLTADDIEKIERAEKDEYEALVSENKEKRTVIRKGNPVMRERALVVEDYLAYVAEKAKEGQKPGGTAEKIKTLEGYEQMEEVMDELGLELQVKKIGPMWHIQAVPRKLNVERGHRVGARMDAHDDEYEDGPLDAREAYMYAMGQEDALEAHKDQVAEFERHKAAYEMKQLRRQLAEQKERSDQLQTHVNQMMYAIMSRLPLESQKPPVAEHPPADSQAVA